MEQFLPVYEDVQVQLFGDEQVPLFKQTGLHIGVLQVGPVY
jgi:hypothetical protein